MYYLHKPMSSGLLNKMEILNESFYFFANYAMILFSELVGDAETRYQMGYKFTFFILIVFVVNFILIFGDMAGEIRFKIKKKNAEMKWV